MSQNTSRQYPDNSHLSEKELKHHDEIDFQIPEKGNVLGHELKPWKQIKQDLGTVDVSGLNENRQICIKYVQYESEIHIPKSVLKKATLYQFADAETGNIIGGKVDFRHEDCIRGTSFQEPSLISPHSYDVLFSYSVQHGLISGANNPTHDLVTPSNDYFLTKEIWVGFDPNAYGFIECGAIKGTNIATLGTWIGYFSGFQTCSDLQGNGCSYQGYTYGNWNPDSDTGAVYEVRFGPNWITLINGNGHVQTPYSSSNTGYVGNWGIENAGTSNYFVSGTVMNGTQYRDVNGVAHMIQNYDQYQYGNYPSNSVSSFSYVGGDVGNITTFTHS